MHWVEDFDIELEMELGKFFRPLVKTADQGRIAGFLKVFMGSI